MERTHSQLPAVLYSLSRDSAVNLAIEESLLSMVQTGQKFLFLYENNSAVIFGRFQNPWKECRTGLVRRSETVFRRRISGGGTVVHGPGNLNFSIISGSSTPDKEGNLKGVIRALSGIGVEIEMNDRFDLLIRKLPEPGGGVFKVSGSAFRQTSRGSIHHATLLVNANLENLGIFLRPLKRIIETRSVASVPSPVANLGEISSGLTVMDVVGALSEEWGFPGGAS
ncbi:MAG: hypothetical protein KAH21_08440, partial [Spirochaetaceae bacterium]|nr:hypothetical protein [Spirochaetaceae bacterium]